MAEDEDIKMEDEDIKSIHKHLRAEETPAGADDAIEEDLEEFEEEVEREGEQLEEIEERVGKSIAFHHRDLHTLLKRAVSDDEKIRTLSEKIKKLITGNKHKEALADYKKIIALMGDIDVDLTIASTSMVAILRRLAIYYYKRMKVNEELIKISEDLETRFADKEDLAYLKKVYTLEKREETVIETLVDKLKAITAYGPVGTNGQMIQVSQSFYNLLRAEGLEGWWMQRRQQRRGLETEVTQEV